MSNYTPGHDRQVPKNLVEMAHEETGQWLKRDELETWVFRRFQRLEHQIKRLEEEHEAKVIQNVQLMRDRDAYQRLANDRAEQRDALAAHVERLAEARNNPRTDTLMSILEIIDDSPATSLARRDAQIKANELKRFIGIYLTPGLAHNRATGELQSLQKQAEGHQ